MLKLILVFIVTLPLAIVSGSIYARSSAAPLPTSAPPVSPADPNLNLRPLDEFAKTIRPLLDQYCGECHAPGEMEDLDFLAAQADSDIAGLKDVYVKVLQVLELGTMPPKDCDQLPVAEHKQVVGWIKKTIQATADQPANQQIAGYVVEAFEDSKGNLWFGTMANGVARFDGKTLSYLTTKQGLSGNVVVSIAEEKNGNLWFGTHTGATRFDEKSMTRYQTAQGLDGEGCQILIDRNGRVWAGTNHGVFRFDGQSFSRFDIPNPAIPNPSYKWEFGKAWNLFEDSKGNLWFARDGLGACRYDGKSFTHFTKENGLCSNNVCNILEDRNGNIWFASLSSDFPREINEGGVSRYDGKSITQFPDVKGLHQNDVYTLYKDTKGNIWFGATGLGAYRYDGKTFELFTESNRKDLTQKFGLQSMLEDRNGTLWCGFSGGLFRFDGKTFINVTQDGPWQPEMTPANWQKLVDAMTEVVLEEKEPSLLIHPETRRALDALTNGEFDQASEILLTLQRKNPSETTLQNIPINELGYRLISHRKLDLAIEVFKINTRLHPREFNTYDSLGEAYLYQQNEELAAKNYRKSLELNPDNVGASKALHRIALQVKYGKLLVAPESWLLEVLDTPPSFAPSMSWVGSEHLRLPPEFRNTDSEWFCSYLFAIDLTEPAEMSEELIAEQILLYFRGLANAFEKKSIPIEAEKFSIKPTKPVGQRAKGEYAFQMTWQEPFVNGDHQKINLNVKMITGKNEHGVVFICGSPQPFDSAVWKELLRIRTDFEQAPSGESK